jgi:hypothetical protein
MTWISMKEKKLNSDMMLTLAIYVKNAVVKFLIYFTSNMHISGEIMEITSDRLWLSQKLTSSGDITSIECWWHWHLVADLFYIFFLAFTCLSSMASINYFSIIIRDGRGHDRMVIGFTTAYAISHYHHWCCEFQSRSEWGVQHYVITFVSDMRQVSGFLQVLWFPSPIKLTATI